jgi:hypothetical protein
LSPEKGATGVAKKTAKAAARVTRRHRSGADCCAALTTFPRFFEEIGTESRHRGWMIQAVIVNRWKTLGMR